MDATSTIGRPPSAGPQKGTALARPAPVAEQISRAAAGAPGAEKAKPLPKLTGVARIEKRTELDVDRPTGLVIGRLVDFETGRVVQQVPSEEAVRILERARQLIGAILDKTA